MELEPQTQPVARPRSSRSRHGSSSKASSCRPPSPDSACEHDGDWAGGTTSGQEEVTSDLSEESSDTTQNSCSRKSGPSMRRKSDLGPMRGGQDSDVDSGIVAYGKPGQRIGSTSSADTDSSQESRRRIEYSPPLTKSELKARGASSSLRIQKHSSLTETSGPIKGDHLALKECNRRPPTPLSVFPESHHCVRFDEQLQLSEQNIRRSCRKLFATLYAQRFSYPNRPNSSSLLHGRNGASASVRVRSRTAPELELRRYSPISVDGSNRHVRNHKQSPVAGRRAEAIAWARSLQKSTSDISVVKKAPLAQQIQHFKTAYQYPMEDESRTSHNSVFMESPVDSYNSGTRCTCVTRQNSVPVSSSQSPSCTCRCCNCAQQPSKTMGLYKSSSCSTLSSALSHQSRPQLTQFPQKNLKKPVAQTESADARLQKTASCSNLLDRNLQVSNVPVYSDNMVHVYAHIASVIPEDVKASSQGGRRAKALAKKQSTENIYDAIRPPSASSKCDSVRTEPGNDKRHSRDIYKDIENSRTGRESYSESISKMSCSSDRKSVSSEIYSQVGEVGNSSVSSRQSLRERNHRYNQRPRSVGVVVPSPVYLKSALKKPTQSALQNVNESSMDMQSANLNGHLMEAEYAVVDKSKKNRFASLPALNGGCNGNTNAIDNDDKDHPPVPPKKMLHKSDFSLYRSRSSSPKKTLMERMHTLTRNAKSAIQKAFSTERIYRPEREERMEAGQKSLQRSRSFIKGLAGSFRRKKKKPRNVMAEVVTHGSSNSDWDESPCGPNSPIHVRGQLLQLNLDGSQVVELTKPPSKPYGFFVARGRVRNSKGVFVSRMRDQETQKQLAGLLDIGDEILEIDGRNVKNADILEVNDLMSNKNTLLLTVLPYTCRKDT